MISRFTTEYKLYSCNNGEVYANLRRCASINSYERMIRCNFDYEDCFRIAHKQLKHANLSKCCMVHMEIKCFDDKNNVVKIDAYDFGIDCNNQICP